MYYTITTQTYRVSDKFLYQPTILKIRADSLNAALKTARDLLCVSDDLTRILDINVSKSNLTNEIKKAQELLQKKTIYLNSHTYG